MIRFVAKILLIGVLTLWGPSTMASSSSAASWELLNPEDVIHVAWPASAPDFKQPKEEWNSALNTAVREYGLKGGIDTHLETIDFESYQGGFYPANTTIKRTEALKRLLDNPKVKVIQWGRGGFGGTETLAQLWGAGYQPPHQIPVFGMSDATTFPLYYPTHPFFHAPMAITNGESYSFVGSVNKDSTLKPMVDILMGRVSEVSYQLRVYNPSAISGSRITSFIQGGNASVIFRHNGTPQQLKPHEGAILFLEDVEELCHRARSVFFTGAIRSGLINHSTAALFLGNMPLTETTSTAVEIIAKMLQENKLGHIPILYSQEFGHGDINGILPFNTPAVMTFTGDKKEAKITIQTRKLHSVKSR